MADTEDMNREGAETYLRLLAEATMRRSLEAARGQPGSPDPGGHRVGLRAVGQALAAVGAVDLVTLEEILADFNLAMTVRQLDDLAAQTTGQRVPPSVRAARIAGQLAPGQSFRQLALPRTVRMRPGQRPAGTADPGPGPGRPEPGRPEPRRPEPGTGPGGPPADLFVPVGLMVPFRDGAQHRGAARRETHDGKSGLFGRCRAC